MGAGDYLNRGADPYAVIAQLTRSSEDATKEREEKQRKEKGSIWNALIGAITNQVMSGKVLPTTPEEWGTMALTGARAFMEEPTEVGAVKSAIGAYDVRNTLTANKLAQEKAAREAEAEKIKLEQDKIATNKTEAETLNLLNKNFIKVAKPTMAYKPEQYSGLHLRTAIPVDKKGKQIDAEKYQMLNIIDPTGNLAKRYITNEEMRTKMVGTPAGMDPGVLDLGKDMTGGQYWKNKPTETIPYGYLSDGKGGLVRDIRIPTVTNKNSNKRTTNNKSNVITLNEDETKIANAASGKTIDEANNIIDNAPISASSKFRIKKIIKLNKVTANPKNKKREG